MRSADALDLKVRKAKRTSFTRTYRSWRTGGDHIFLGEIRLDVDLFVGQVENKIDRFT